MNQGIIFDIMKYSIQDGPGIRTTVFFKGCPLKCWWCHNPESQHLKQELMFRPEKCIGCGDCLKVCPNNAVTKNYGVNKENCIVCGKCTEVCYAEARELIGKKYSVEEVIKEIEKDRIFYQESNGGVTISGGEPLAQPKFLESLLKACKENGFHTALDTTGYGEQEVLLKISKYVDLFLYDLKIMDDKNHKYYTGVSNKIILDNLKALAANNNKIIIRVPIIPGINDDYENISKIGEYVAALKSVKDLNLIPYHQTGVKKYLRLNREYKLLNCTPPQEAKMIEIKNLLEEYGLEVKIGG